jgi:hypothetical protein
MNTSVTCIPVKSRRMWGMYIARMEGDACRVMVGKPELNRSLRRPKDR